MDADLRPIQELDVEGTSSLLVSGGSFDSNAAAAPGDDMVGIPVTSFHSDRGGRSSQRSSASGDGRNNNGNTGSSQRMSSGSMTSAMSTDTPGAYSVESRPAGQLPAWRRRLQSSSRYGQRSNRSNRSNLSDSERSGGSRGQELHQQQEQSRAGLSQPPSSNSPGGGSNIYPRDDQRDDQSAVPPELRQTRQSHARRSRFASFFVGNRCNDGPSSAASSSRLYRFSLFGGDADVQPQERASLPTHDDLEETTYRKGLLTVICISVIVIAIVVGVVVGVTSGGGDDKELDAPSAETFPTPTPTLLEGPPANSPIVPPLGETQRLAEIRNIVLSLSKEEETTSLYNPSTPQYEALLWIAERDPLQISLEDIPRLRSRYALATLFYATDGTRWYGSYDFLSGNHECDWSPDPVTHLGRRGISCNDNEEVVSIMFGKFLCLMTFALQLRSVLLMNLNVYVCLLSFAVSANPAINTDGNNMAGSIPIEIRGLSKLQYLTISNNTQIYNDGNDGTLEKNPLLDGIDSLSNIEYLSNLKLLDLSHNLFDATIPASLARMSNLEILSLESNRFKFTIPNEFVLLTNLKQLSISNNRLFGNIEDVIQFLPKLEVLEAAFNDFSISPDLSFPSTIKILTLDQNRITRSPLTSYIGRLSNLQHLNLNRMDIAGQLPPEIRFMTNLESLHLGQNTMTGPFPWSSMIASGSAASLRDLFIAQCAFTGQLPSDLGRFAALTSLGLMRNSFTGTVPDSIGDLTSLFAFNANRNNLSGTIPTTVGNLSSLFQFDVSYNQLTGTIPTEMNDMVSLGKYLAIAAP